MVVLQINKIFISYEKFISDKKINKEDMILKQHENEEVKKISVKHFGLTFSSS